MVAILREAIVGVWYRRKLRGTRVASNGGRVRVRIIHGLNISHKDSHSIQRTLYESSYYTHLGCPSY